MSVREGPIARYIGTASESKPTSVPKGTTYLEYDEGVQIITPDGGSNWYPKDADLVDFFFRPGQVPLASGMVESGTRSYNPAVVSTASVASTTVWSNAISYEPYKSGKIDGLSVGGIIEGQLTIGYIASATVGNTKLTARIQNKDNANWVTMLTLTATIATATTVAYKAYDIPFLQTTSTFNAVPFSIAIGVQTDASANSVQARLMESSWIAGQFIPGT